MQKSSTEKLIVVRTLHELKALEEYIADKDYIAYDTETTGTEKDSEIIGFSIAADVTTGYYVILSYWDSKSENLVYLETKKGAKAFLEKLKTHPLLMQKADFDCWMTVNNFGVELMPSVHTDTLYAGHLLNENRMNGLKERAVELYGEDEREEQKAMKESVYKNGGVLTKEKYELYKADADLMAYYGAKDAILTMKLFFNDVPKLFEENLDKFFYEDETMPLLRGPTYDLNTTGLRVAPVKLASLKATLETECLEAKAFIYKEITPHVKEKYKGTTPKNTFNIGASQQLAWLCFIKLGNEFNNLTKGGRALCKALDIRIPYAPAAKRAFIQDLIDNKDREYAPAAYNPKTKKMGRPKKVGDPWKYLACGKESLAKLSKKYKWVAKYLEYAKNKKLLNTYVEGIQSKMKYNIIRPSFIQNGTTSGRYSCKRPNFQNLPRDDKRIKSCIIARQGKIFVGADYSQLEPRVFASVSGDERLLACFKNGDDFYSAVGVPIFGRHGESLKKGDKDSFATLHPNERQDSKVIALAAPYGQTAAKLAPSLGRSMDAAQQLIDDYFENWPKVKEMQLRIHEEVKDTGVVYNLFGRPRRIPKAKLIREFYGNAKHEDLPYKIRTLLNLAVNHTIQSTGASIMNRAAVEFCRRRAELAVDDAGWLEVKIVLQVHDELVLEGPERLRLEMMKVLKVAMEETSSLPGVELIAQPVSAYNLADLKT